MKIIAIGTMKGGTGKTTLAFNLGGLLAEKKRVLLWDIDPQCNLSQSAGLELDTRTGYTTRDIFEDPKLDPALVAVPLEENLSIIPGSIDLTVTEAMLPSKAGKEMILRYYIEDNRAFFEQYDYVILDTNPSMSNVNQNGFVAADRIILVSDVSLHSIRGVELFQFLWKEVRTSLRLPDTVRALVLNNYDARLNMARELLAYCQEQDHLAPLVIPTVIPSRVAYKKAALQNTPVTRLEPKGGAAEILRQVTADLEQKGVF